MKIYIAGPMRGYPYFNFPAFHTAAEMLRNDGHEVWSPAEEDEKLYGEFYHLYQNGDIEDQKDFEKVFGFNLRTTLGEDLNFICNHADCVYMLKGWENSKGAKAEHATAEALGLEIWYEE